MMNVTHSQRLTGFNGGIQTGTCAASPNSIRLDTDLRTASSLAYKRLSQTTPDIKVTYKIAPLFEDAAGCAPDGGLWTYRDTPIVAFEAKHQGEGGNAIERWSKNYMVVKYLNAKASYVTFTTGAGTKPRGAISRFFNLMFGLAGQAPQYNVVNPCGISVYREENGFEMDYLVDVMVECVEKTISELDD
jgi:hypothetical protein